MNLAVAQVLADTDGKSRVQDLHAAGLAQLLEGKPNDAVRTLELAVQRSTGSNDLRTAIETTREAALLSDLSAAYYERSIATVAPNDVTAALDAVNRAWQLEQTPEIAWNRAIALSHYSGGEAAWDDFLRVNTDPAWREEAEERKNNLKPLSSDAQWRAVVPRLATLAAAGRDSEIADAAAEFPAPARNYFEKIVLVEWAERQHRKEQSDDARRLARAIAAGLARTGERFPMAVTVAIDDACSDVRCDGLASAHLAFSRAANVLNDHDYARGLVAMDDAARQLTRFRSPYALAADFQTLVCAVQASDYDAALRGARGLLTQVRNRGYRTLEARTLWLIGLCELQALHPEEALEHYRAAETLFIDGRDETNLASIRVRLADALEFVGAPDEATAYRLSALQTMRAVEDKRDYGLMMYEAGQSAMSRGWPSAADALLSETMLLALDAGRPDLGTMAALWRAANFARAGDFVSAGEQVRFARQLSDRIPDQAVRKRVRVSSGAILGRTGLAEQPRRDLTEAIEFFEHTGTRTWIPELLHQRATVSEREGDPQAAERDLQQAISIAEDVIGEGAPGDVRDGFGRDIRETYKDLIRLLLASGREGEALEIAERARLLGRRAARHRRPLRVLAEALPPSVQLAVFEVQPESLVVWVMTRGDIRMYASPVMQGDLHRAVREVERGEPSIESMADLYDLLLRPWLARAPELDELVLAPSPDLDAVPFAALYDRTTRRHVIDDFTVSTTLSTTEFTDRSATIRSDGAGVLIVGDAAYRGMGRLPASRIEATSIGNLYEGATILSGRNATASRFLDALDGANMLHFGGHAENNTHAPRLSALILAGEEGEDDSRVYVHELLKRRMPLDLVVLSACSTAQSRAGDARGNVTIARAFLDGGAKTVVATLRPVPDDAAAAFSVRFHEALRNGSAPAAAVRAAQLHVRSRPRSGAAWAAFCVVQGA
ncbi:MAG: CHAT domain-containing protein [Thermoanaerobaculia bacterium]